MDIDHHRGRWQEITLRVLEFGETAFRRLLDTIVEGKHHVTPLLRFTEFQTGLIIARGSLRPEFPSAAAAEDVIVAEFDAGRARFSSIAKLLHRFDPDLRDVIDVIWQGIGILDVT